MLRHACGFALANKGHDTRALQASRPRRLNSSPPVSVKGDPFLRLGPIDGWHRSGLADMIFFFIRQG
jgi:hypothetical protein